MKLKLGEGLALPIDVVTEKLAFLGRTGTGKTYAAMKLAELMLEAGAQAIALDAVGKWYGLRVAGAGPGFPIPVFGGLNGDFPLEATGGKLMADVLTDRGISAVLDVSQFTHAEQTRFATDFATQFFQRKKSSPSAVHIFLEECQEFVPQNAMPGEHQMLSAYERLWKLGRNFGIGGSLISQRPQEINKKALNQAGTLLVFQMTGPQERKAIEQWVSAQGINEDIAAVLPTLKQGQPHVWSPTFLGISRTVAIAEKRTADVSSTPKVGARSQERSLTPIDAEKFRVEMAATVERAKADDPRELRRRIQELERALRQAKQPAPATAVKVERVEVPVLVDEDRARLAEFVQSLRTAAETLSARAEEILGALRRVGQAPARPTQQAVARPQKPTVGIPRRRGNPAPAPALARDLTGPEQRILDAIGWLESIGVETPEQPAVAFLAGYTYGGGAFNNPRGSLRTRGLVEYVGSERIRLTDGGRKLANVPPTPLGPEDLQDAVLERLPGPEQRLLRPLLDAYPEALSNEQLAEKAGYTPNAGAYNNPRGRLRSLGLIEYPQPGHVVARSLLFLE